MSDARIIPAPYRQPLWGTLDRVSRNCLITAAVCGLVVLVAVFVAPSVPVREATIQEMPERFARLILEKPAPAPARVKPATQASEAPTTVARVEEPKPAPTRPAAARPQPKAQAKPRPTRRAAPEVAPDKGQAGRDKATVEVAQNLKAATGSLDKALADLGQSLPAAGSGDKTRERPRRRARGSVRSGRASAQLEAVDLVADLSTGNATGSELAVRTIDIAAITQVSIGDGEGMSGGDERAGGGSGAGLGSGGGEVRSNESLLAVVRRYAPGIQFCYENILKKDPGLRGKLVVSLTVAADGTVSDVTVLDDSLHSRAVSDCVLAQMQGWRFPVVPAGVVTFQAPFVFTPPN